MYLTIEQARAKFPGAWIGQDAVIERGARIGQDAWIGTICHKYIANIVPMPDNKILIRIGCETHSIDSWQEHGATLAKKHGESVWWESHGKRILAFMIAEAELYAKGQEIKP